MTIEEILKRMAEDSDLSLYPDGFRLLKADGHTTHISNPRFYELFRDGYIEFTSGQGHFEVDVVKLSLTPKGRGLVE